MINREIQRKKIAKRDGAKREVLKAALLAADTLEGKLAGMTSLAKMDRNGSKSRQRNRCAFTGRPHGYHRAFGVARVMLREMASKGLLPGVRKASW
jgi:small subunit ribosomal protein S14